MDDNLEDLEDIVFYVSVHVSYTCLHYFIHGRWQIE